MQILHVPVSRFPYNSGRKEKPMPANNLPTGRDAEPNVATMAPPCAEANKDAAYAERFNRLAAEWQRETHLSSKIKDKVAHLAYQKIIGMGPAAIPLILKDLNDNGPNHWFSALHAITEENPVPQDQRGNIVGMTEAWLQWGRKKGYLTDCQKNTNETSPT
jgi:hypothetical protein